MEKLIVLAYVLIASLSGFIAASLATSHHHKQELIEGDILLTRPVKKLISLKHRTRREVTTQLIRRWSNSVVPYTIDPKLGKDARRAIRKAIREFHKHTCVEFIPKTNQKDYIYFKRDYGCYSPIGRQGGRQKLAVGEGCEYKGTIMHELMHALGFFHEHSRFDRDKYVKILWWNIEPNFVKNFESYSHGDVDTLDTPYDYNSLMHYDNLAFSKNRQNTIEALDDSSKQLGQLDSFSATDIKQLLKIYKCRSIDKDPLPAQPMRSKTSEKDESQENQKTSETKRHLANCKDLFPSTCKVFASYKGYCKYWKSFMEKQCPLSCGMCKKEMKRFSIWNPENYKPRQNGRRND
ncbi:zinc metalloproteinase nas-4-like [Actinia tenebrosa]|uniref:Metalloendopeptidase n=1 Tax=Actinia tenebrosa TaxID=6105 RepID=A0A6P8IXS4_ACTTE|nr:zinc metalloproteinase nas-4-like [Actinia tenebrosa]